MQIAIDSCALIYPTLSVRRNHYFRPAAPLRTSRKLALSRLLYLRKEARGTVTRGECCP